MTESAQVTRQLTVSDMAAYLGTSGWSLVHDGEALQSWRLGDTPSADRILQLPIDDSYADFDFNFRRALRQLQKLYGWDSQQLLNEILGARSDVLFVRASQFTSDGTIPIKEAQTLIQGAIELVTSAARATLEPRRTFVGRPPTQVAKFIDDDVRMGHTQVGSFVMTIMTRLDAQGDADSSNKTHSNSVESALEDLPNGTHAAIQRGYIPPFQRRVMTNLANSLTYLKTAADRALEHPESTVPSADDALARGVSSQLCLALSEMTTQAGVQALDLSFNWASGEPDPPPVVEHLVFTRDSLTVVDALQIKLRETSATSRLTEVTGYVTHLERGLDEDEGIVTVRGFSGKVQRRVRLALAGREYTEAVNAHDSRQLVSVSGNLVREGNGYFLRGPVKLSTAGEAVPPN